MTVEGITKATKHFLKTLEEEEIYKFNSELLNEKKDEIENTAKRLRTFVQSFKKISDSGLVDIDISDEEGNILIEIKKYSMKQVDQSAANEFGKNSAQNRYQTQFSWLEKLSSSQTEKNNDSLNQGLTRSEGQEVFDLLLNRCFKPQIIVSKNDINEVLSEDPYSIQEVEDDEVDKIKYPRPDLQTEYIAARNEIEKKLSYIWQDALGIEKIGIHDDFFELGGDSLLLVQLYTRLKKHYSTDIAVVDLYKYKTINLLAKYLDKSREEQQSSAKKND